MTLTKHCTAKAQKEPSSPFESFAVQSRDRKWRRDCHLEPETYIRWGEKKQRGDFLSKWLDFVCAPASSNASRCFGYSYVY